MFLSARCDLIWTRNWHPCCRRMTSILRSLGSVKTRPLAQAGAAKSQQLRQLSWLPQPLGSARQCRQHYQRQLCCSSSNPREQVALEEGYTSDEEMLIIPEAPAVLRMPRPRGGDSAVAAAEAYAFARANVDFEKQDGPHIFSEAPGVVISDRGPGPRASRDDEDIYYDGMGSPPAPYEVQPEDEGSAGSSYEDVMAAFQPQGGVAQQRQQAEGLASMDGMVGNYEVWLGQRGATTSQVQQVLQAVEATASSEAGEGAGVEDLE